MMPDAAFRLYWIEPGILKMKIFFRKIHRWLGLLMALQIIAWMFSGLYFAIFPIETIRGEHLTGLATRLKGQDLANLISPSEAWSLVSSQQGQGSRLGKISLQKNLGHTWYRVSGTLEDASFTRMVNARNGELMSFLSAGEASEIAEARLLVKGVISKTELVEEPTRGGEYRGRDLPVWRVSFDEPENLNLYIDGWTGEIVARRTNRWRVFDFLWMLHIMDFDERDDFNTPLLQIAAALGLFVALSGLIFWAMTTRLFRSRKSQPGQT
jgi:uncharacterized iron-regulated membrane protein